jgi:cytochrome c oxidase assembly protein subunit 15
MARVHSGIVLALAATTLGLLYLLVRDGAPSTVVDRARTLLGVMVAQGVVGYIQYFNHLPALLVGVHVLGATALWMAMLWFHDGLHVHGAVHPAPLTMHAVDVAAAAAERPVPPPGDVSGRAVTPASP